LYQLHILKQSYWQCTQKTSIAGRFQSEKNCQWFKLKPFVSSFTFTATDKSTILQIFMWYLQINSFFLFVIWMKLKKSNLFNVSKKLMREYSLFTSCRSHKKISSQTAQTHKKINNISYKINSILFEEIYIFLKSECGSSINFLWVVNVFLNTNLYWIVMRKFCNL